MKIKAKMAFWQVEYALHGSERQTKKEVKKYKKIRKNPRITKEEVMKIYKELKSEEVGLIGCKTIASS